MKKIYALVSMLAAGAMSLAQAPSMEHVTTYFTGVFDEGAAEIVTFDSTSNQLFFTNSNDNSVGILDFSDPTSLTLVDEISLDPYGDGVNSVSAYGGFIAVAVEVDDEDGKVVFFESDGTFAAEVTVGNLPDMVTFTHDGNKVVVACEGEPNDAFTVDPQGSIAVIDVSGGVSGVSQGDVTIIGFDGVALGNDVRIFGNEDIILYEESFQDTALQLNEFLSFSQLSNRDWFYDDFGDDWFAEMNGFSADTTSIDWLVSPLIDLEGTFDEAHFSFENTRNFSGGSLDLLISTDYDGLGDPTTATWDTITNQAIWSPGGFTDTNSGPIDLDAYLGEEIAIALLYVGNPGGGNSALWQIDDFEFWFEQSVEANLEPEYVAVSEDNSKAFVVLQENNAVATVDLSTNTIVSVDGLGYKDHSISGMGLDASDKDGMINITNWPVRGLYQPDAIATYTVNGNTYYVTANEGDARDYDAYSEEARIKDVELDSATFLAAATLQEDENLGRLNMTTSMGDIDDDGDFDVLYSYGARSFTIWDENGNVVWDSGEDFEQKTAEAYPDDFNSGNDENDDFEGRSDNKGPEPEAVEIAMLNGEYHAFIGMERMGGVFLYNIHDPANPTFIQYLNNRDFSVEDPTSEDIGDLGVEDVLYVNASSTSDGKTYIVTANEVSGTVSVFVLNNVVGIEEAALSEFKIFPNPANDVLRVSEAGEYTVSDMTGRNVMTVSASTIDVSNLNPGMYFISNAEGKTMTFVKQ